MMKLSSLLFLNLLMITRCSTDDDNTSVRTTTTQTHPTSSSSDPAPHTGNTCPTTQTPAQCTDSPKKVMLIGDSLTDSCFPYLNQSTCPAVNLTCLSASETLIGKFCTMNVAPNTFSLGNCTTSARTYSFNISNIDGRYEVRMNEIVQGVKMWFVPHTSKCLSPEVLNLTGYTSNHNCQEDTTTTISTTTTTPSTATISTTTISATNISTTTNPSTTTISTTTDPSTTIPTSTISTSTNPSTSCTASADCQWNGCLETSPVDPGEKCRNAIYYGDSEICKGNSIYVLYVNGSEWTCVTCVNISTTTTSPTTQTTTTSPTTQTTTNSPTTQTIKVSTNKPHEANFNLSAIPSGEDGCIDPSVASKVLDTMGSLLDEMENSSKTNAGIKMGDVIGVLQIQPKNTETKDINICYSSQQSEINVVETNQKTDFPWSVKIPSEAFDKSRQQNNGSAFVGILRFNNMRNKIQDKNITVLNNEVYGVTMGANISNLTNNIEMIIKQKNLNGNASCSSWDGKGNLSWTTFGCETEMIDNTTINCSCSHLTFFAVLMSPIQTESNTTLPDLETLTLISSIGCGISIFFLSIALFMHFLLRKAKSNQATKILMNMFVALFLLNMSFLSNESVANSGGETACIFIALLMHYSMLATFTWFFIQALHMYLWLIRKNVSITNYMRKITVFGWAFAAPIVIGIVASKQYTKLILNASSGKSAQMCWIMNPSIHYIVNIGFYALVFIFTSGIFIMIVFKIFQARHLKTTDGKKITFRKLLMMVLSLFLLFGLTWAVAFFSYGPMLIPSYYIFTVLNSLQGFFLFLYYIHIHNDVAGTFSDDPQNSVSNTANDKSSITAVENLYN